jgi:hypothetical protein
VIENADDNERLFDAAQSDAGSEPIAELQAFDGSLRTGLPSYESRHHGVYDEAQDIPMQDMRH